MINSFTAYDIALLYNCKLLVQSIQKVLITDFSKADDIIKNILTSVIRDPADLNDLTYKEPIIWADEITNGGIYTLNGKEIKIGYWPELVGKDEKYLFSIVVDQDLIDKKEQEYFPVTESISSENHISCAADSVSDEENLDICQSLLLFEKLQNLIVSSYDCILENLNKIFKGTHKFTPGEYYYFKNTKCGRFIKIDDKPESLYYGMSPNVFFESVVSPESAIVSDYFSSVAIRQELCNFENPSPLIKNAAQFGGSWNYFPICRKLLCVKDFQQRYIQRVLDIIKSGI